MAIFSQEIQSVFCVKIPSEDKPTGTAFVATVSGQRFLITARHVVFDENKQQVVVPEFFRNGIWEPLPASHIIASSEDDDVAVFPLIDLGSDDMSETSLILGGKNMIVGTSALIAGFPYGWLRSGSKINNDCPFAIVKEVLIGGHVSGYESIPSQSIILDRGIPHGFSGSPVFWRDHLGKEPYPYKTSYVLGVVTHQRTDDTQSDGRSGLGLAALANIPLKLIQKFQEANKCNTTSA